MKWTLENKISSGLGLAPMIVVVIVSITYRVTTCFIQDTDWVTHSHKVMEALNGLSAHEKATEILDQSATEATPASGRRLLSG